MSAGQKLLGRDALRVSPVEAETVDLECDRGRHEIVERLTARHARADLRPGDRQVQNVEEFHAIRPLEAFQDGLEGVAPETWAGGHSQADLLQDAVRILPRQEAR